jgi:hypothetical protein
MNIQDVPDEVLQAEARRREKEREEKYREECYQRYRRLTDHQEALLRGKIRGILGVEPDSRQLDDIICAVEDYREATS